MSDKRPSEIPDPGSSADPTPADPTPADPISNGNPPPPSRYLNEKPQGMVSQADLDDTALDNETIRRQRREDNINPARAREQPPED